MTEVLIPPDIIPDEEYIELVDDGTVAFRPVLGRSMEQQQQNYEPRLRVRQVFRNLRLADRARMIAALRMASGAFNTVRAQVGRRFRGSMSVAELLTNNTFANGTTGWSAASASQAVADRVNRVTRSGSDINPQISQNASITQYAPHVTRGFFKAGRGSAAFYAYNNHAGSGSIATGGGMSVLSNVATSASDSFSFYEATAAGMVGDYFDLLYTSLSHCALIDNGPNLLTYSDQFDNAAHTPFGLASVGANAQAAPDGTTTADEINEDGTTTEHGVYEQAAVSSSAADYAYTICLKAANRSWVQVALVETTGPSQASAYFNIAAGAGAVGTATNGSNWSNARGFIRPLGNDWYAITLVARKTNAATTLRSYVIATTGNGAATSIAGISNTAFVAWRATLAQSSVPTRLVQTVATALPNGTAQTGSALYLKGGPASTTAAIAMDDAVELNGEGLQLTASVDFDAAGLGYMQFKPSLFRSPADNDPVIVASPMPRFKLKEAAKWDNRFGLYSSFALTFEQHYE